MDYLESSAEITFVFDTNLLLGNNFLYPKLKQEEEESRINTIQKYAANSKSEVLNEYCKMATVSTDNQHRHCLAYAHIFTPQKANPLLSSFFYFPLKTPITSLPWSPLLCAVNGGNIIQNSESENKMHTFVKQNGINLDKSLITGLLKGTKMVFFINPTYIMTPNNDREDYHLSSPHSFMNINNLLTKNTMQILINKIDDVKIKPFVFETVLRKNVYPTFIYQPPIAIIVQYILNAHLEKNKYFQKHHPMKIMPIMTEAVMNSVQAFVFFETYFGIISEYNQHDKNEQEASNIKHRLKTKENFQTKLEELVTWHYSELWDTEGHEVKELFFEKKHTKEDLLEPISLDAFITQCQSQSAIEKIEKILIKFKKQNMEYTTRLLHLYEIAIIKLTETERIYKNEDDQEEANMKNERLYWPKSDHSFKKLVNLNDFNAVYLNSVNIAWKTMLSPTTSGTMPKTIVVGTHVYDSPDPSMFIVDRSILIKEKSFCVYRKVLETQLWLKTKIMDDKKVVSHLPAAFLASIKKHIDVLDSWKSIENVQNEGFLDLSFVYLLFLETYLSKSYLPRIKNL